MNPFFLRFSLFNCLFFFSWCFLPELYGQDNAPISGDFPDPTVIRVDDRYYAVGTSSEWAPHFPIYSSDDLQNWQQDGFVFDETPEWASSSFWAPEYVYHRGLYYLYYSAKRKTDGVSCIGVAISRYPNRGFEDQGIVVAYGSESIDAFVVEEDGERFMTWKAYGLDQRPIELVASKLSEDGLSIEGEPFSLLMDTAHVGIEGQAFIQKDGYYYMFYSAGACCGPDCDYHIQAVRSQSIRGPFERVGEAVLLGENEHWKCMGHGTFVENTDGDLLYLFHGYSQSGGVYTGREGLLARLVWSDTDTPVFEVIDGARSPQPAISTLDFTTVTPEEIKLQWDFRHAAPEWRLDAGGLYMRGTYSKENQTGMVLTRRPATKAYTIQAEIDRQKSTFEALKGVSVYGDVNRAIGLGLVQNELQVWISDEQGIETLTRVMIDEDSPSVQLRIDIEENLACRFYYRTSGERWQELSMEDRQITLSGLAPWDRSPRPGLHMRSEQNETAVFRSMTLIEGRATETPGTVDGD